MEMTELLGYGVARRTDGGVQPKNGGEVGYYPETTSLRLVAALALLASLGAGARRRDALSHGRRPPGGNRASHRPRLGDLPHSGGTAQRSGTRR